jgi:PadR family transcriptional regulator, regulatory protein AphA
VDVKLLPVIRLTGTSYAVLGVLNALGPATPYDLKQAMEVSVANFWPIPHTTAYAEPERLAKAGLLSVDQEPNGRRRKLYSLTDTGRDALRQWAASTNLSPPQLREEGVLKIFAGADPMPIIAERLAWHREKLAELEGYLEALGEDTAMAGVRTSLLVGVGYESLIVGALERALDAGEIPSPPGSRASAAVAGGSDAAGTPAPTS